MSSLVELESVVKVYQRGAEEIRAINDVTLCVEEGDYVSVVGPSGSGKTSLLNLLGCVDRPTDGTVRVHGLEVEDLTDNTLAAIRSTSIGFVFQHFFLIPTLTAIENVMLPARFCRKGVEGLEPRARSLLEMVGMEERADHLPAELSGGEMQRVAIARALINDPAMLLADEPTGNLDSQRAEEISDLFTELNRTGLTIVVVTHNESMASNSLRHIHLKDGAVESDERRALPVVRTSEIAQAEPEEPAVTDGPAVSGEPAETLPADDGRHTAVPDYVPVQLKRPRGSAVLALVASLLGAGVIASTFFRWFLIYSGSRIMTIEAFPQSIFKGPFLLRTVGPDNAILFTGFWSLLLGAVLLISGLMLFLNVRGHRWIMLGVAGLATAFASINIFSIYTEMQPSELGPRFVYGNTSPGLGLWLFVCCAAAALILAALEGWFFFLLRETPAEAEEMENALTT